MIALAYDPKYMWLRAVNLHCRKPMNNTLILAKLIMQSFGDCTAARMDKAVHFCKVYHGKRCNRTMRNESFRQETDQFMQVGQPRTAP